MSVCLFCKTEGAFRSKEHIIPESLDNDTDILENVICEKCQNYLGRKIEKPALEKTNLAFWRSYLGIRTKRNQLPSVNLDPPIRGAIPSLHPMTELGIGFTAHKDGSTSIDVSNPWQKKRFLRDKSEYLLVMTPWHLSILGKFLGKMGLEFVALTDINYALSPEFDRIRSFVRFGSTKHLWPIYCGQQGKLTELKGPIIWDGSEGQQEIECYRYSLGRKLTGGMVFAFSIGTDLMLICLSSDLPDPSLEDCVVGVRLSCLHYPDGTW
jgi:hypothetical protein